MTETTAEKLREGDVFVHKNFAQGEPATVVKVSQFYDLIDVSYRGRSVRGVVTLACDQKVELLAK